ncbi:unnamed protein product [Paramecium primaurelia]|uniref:Uncharacterized protein n=1 Tax=Paramecium primaurelia TaxID=5886 RepID=A0A8S1NHC4_PARPR|nr:unnamed protein product [Paramecium primaurelia]
MLFDVILTDREASISNLGIKLIYFMDYHLDPQILAKLVGFEYDFNSKQVKISFSYLVTQEDSWQTKKGHEAQIFESVASFEYQTRFIDLLESIYKHQEKISHTQTLCTFCCKINFKATKGPQKSRFRQSTLNKKFKSKASYFSADRQYAQSKFFSGLKKRSNTYIYQVQYCYQNNILSTHILALQQAANPQFCIKFHANRVSQLSIKEKIKKLNFTQSHHIKILQQLRSDQDCVQTYSLLLIFSQKLSLLMLKTGITRYINDQQHNLYQEKFLFYLEFLMQILNMLLDSPFYLIYYQNYTQTMPEFHNQKKEKEKFQCIAWSKVIMNNKKISMKLLLKLKVWKKEYLEQLLKLKKRRRFKTVQDFFQIIQIQYIQKNTSNKKKNLEKVDQVQNQYMV